MAFGARQSRMVLCVQCLRVRTRAAAMCASRWSEGSGGGGRGSALLLHVTVVWLHVTCGRRSRPCRRGLAMLFALRRRHLAELGGLRTHPKNTNRVHWSGKTRRPFRLLFVATQSLHILRNMVHRVAKAAENMLRCRLIGTSPILLPQKRGVAPQKQRALRIWGRRRTLQQRGKRPWGCASGHKIPAPLSAGVTVSAYARKDNMLSFLGVCILEHLAVKRRLVWSLIGSRGSAPPSAIRAKPSTKWHAPQLLSLASTIWGRQTWRCRCQTF